MPEVSIIKTLTGYTFEWKAEKLTAKVSRIHIHSDGRLTGDISLMLGKKQQAEPSFGFNFSSSQTRKQLVNSMTEKYPEWTWLPIIDELCLSVQRLAKEGEPVTIVKSTDETEELQYLIYPLVPLGKPTAIFGSPGSGKSQVALIANIIVSLPWYDNPLHLTAPAQPTKLLFLDYEADIDDIQRQLVYLTNGMDLGYCDIAYRHCSLPLEADLDGIRLHMENIGAKGIIVDSMSLAAGGDLNRMDVATAYIRALRSLGSGITSISLGHTSKEDVKTKSIIGSILFEAGFRNVWECRGSEGQDYLDIALFHRKANLSRKFKEIGMRINYNSHGYTLESLDPNSIPDFVERMRARDQVLNRLKRGKLSTKELVDLTELKRATIETALSRLRKAGKVQGDAQGWMLVDNTQASF